MAGLTLSAEDRAMLSPEEIAALTATDAGELLDTIGDDDGDTPPAAAAKPATAAATPDPEDDDDELDDDPAVAKADGQQQADDADAAQDDAADEGDDEAKAKPKAADQAQDLLDDEPPPVLEATTTKDFDVERKAIRAERRDIEAKWASGELSDDERQTQLDALDDRAETLIREQARADALREVNEAQQRAYQQRIERMEQDATMGIIKAAKAAGTIDYVADQLAQRQFDMALNMLKADPSNARTRPNVLVDQAHAAVLALRGIAAAQPQANTAASQPQAKPQPQPKSPRQVPVTLAGVPAAARPVVNDDIMEQVADMDPIEMERWMADLSPAQQRRVMQLADSRGGH